MPRHSASSFLLNKSLLKNNMDFLRFVWITYLE